MAECCDPNGEELVLARGRDAWQRLGQDATWADWLSIGEALLVARAQATARSNSNAPVGRAYARAMAHLLAEYGFDRIDKGDRSRLLQCLENRAAIETWRSVLPLTERLRLNHPSTVLRRWKAAQISKATETSSSRLQLQDRIVELLESNDKLAAENQMLRQRGGAGFMPGTPADEAAERIAKYHHPQYLRRLAAALMEIADREEHQDPVEFSKGGLH
jgi:hypothetical protein